MSRLPHLPLTGLMSLNSAKTPIKNLRCHLTWRCRLMANYPSFPPAWSPHLACPRISLLKCFKRCLKTPRLWNWSTVQISWLIWWSRTPTSRRWSIKPQRWRRFLTCLTLRKVSRVQIVFSVPWRRSCKWKLQVKHPRGPPRRWREWTQRCLLPCLQAKAQLKVYPRKLPNPKTQIKPTHALCTPQNLPQSKIWASPTKKKF